MLKATVNYGSQELRLQQKVPETGTVNGHVRPFDIFLWGSWSALLGCLGLFIFIIVQKLIFHILFCHGTENRRQREAEMQLRCRQENPLGREGRSGKGLAGQTLKQAELSGAPAQCLPLWPIAPLSPPPSNLSSATHRTPPSNATTVKHAKVFSEIPIPHYSWE